MNNLPTQTQEAIHRISYDQDTGTYGVRENMDPTHFVGTMVFERVQPVPLPPAILFFISAFVGLGFFRKRR